MINSTNSSTSSSTEPSLLPFLSPLPASLVLFCLYLVLLSANLGVVHYERVVPDTHRTLLNRLAALASLYQAGVATALYPMLVARSLVRAGLGEAFCFVNDTLYRLSMLQCFLVFNELVLMRYVYICRLRAVGTLREDLVFAYLACMNLVLGLFFSLLFGVTAIRPGEAFRSYCVSVDKLAGKYYLLLHSSYKQMIICPCTYRCGRFAKAHRHPDDRPGVRDLPEPPDHRLEDLEEETQIPGGPAAAAAANER